MRYFSYIWKHLNLVFIAAMSICVLKDESKEQKRPAILVCLYVVCRKNNEMAQFCSVVIYR